MIERILKYFEAWHWLDKYYDWVWKRANAKLNSMERFPEPKGSYTMANIFTIVDSGHRHKPNKKYAIAELPKIT